MKYLFFFLLLLLGIEIYGYIDFLNYSHGLIIERVMAKFSNTYLIEQFPFLFTEQRFRILQIAIPGILLLQGISLLLVFRYRLSISNYINNILIEFKNEWKKIVQVCKALRSPQLLLLVLITLLIIFTRIYLIDKYPFSGDEAQAYFTFVNNGFLLTTTFYPEPNNHILYDLFTMLFDPFIKDPMFVMRVPNIFLNLLVLAIGFIYLLGKRNFTTALLFLVIAGLSFSTSIYAIQGRGYMLLSLFTVISIISCIRLTENSKSKLAFVTLIISSILAIYTIPIFLFLFVGFSFYLGLFFNKKKQFIDLRKVIWYFILTNIGWILLYLPVFLVSGIDAVFSNEIIIKHSPAHYFSFVFPVACIEAINFILGTFSKGYIILLILSFFILYTIKKSKDSFIKNFVALSLINTFFFIFFMVIQLVFGEGRIFMMYGFFLSIILALCLSYWIDKINITGVYNIIIGLLTLFFMFLIPLTFERKMDTFYGVNYFQHFRKISDDVSFISSYHPKNVYVTSKGPLLYLKWHNAKTDETINIHTQNSVNNLPFDYLVMDRINDLPKNVDLQNYQQVMAKSNALIYKKK